MDVCPMSCGMEVESSSTAFSFSFPTPARCRQRDDDDDIVFFSVVYSFFFPPSSFFSVFNGGQRGVQYDDAFGVTMGQQQQKKRLTINYGGSKLEYYFYQIQSSFVRCGCAYITELLTASPSEVRCATLLFSFSHAISAMSQRSLRCGDCMRQL